MENADSLICKSKKTIPDWVKVVASNLILAILIVFFFCPECFYPIENFTNRQPAIFYAIFYSFLLCLFLGIGNAWIINRIDEKISWIETPIKRLVIGTIAVILYSFIVSLITGYAYNLLVFDRQPFGIDTWEHTLEAAILPVYIAIFLTIILTSRSFLLAWRKSTIDTERLKRENLQAQYEALKNQINPHFLFNSFNVLTDLVYMDQDLAASFISQLSQVFRYVLESSKKEMVPLESELQNLEAYIFLLKMRFGENLVINRSKCPEGGFHIVPLCLQMLLENAVKHNVISEEEKLVIEIWEENDYIHLSNNLQLRNLSERSTKLGLENIKARYELIPGKKVKIMQNDDRFVVAIPLIKSKL